MPIAMFEQFEEGYRLPNGDQLAQMWANLYSTVTGLVAFAGGGRTSATPLTEALNVVATVGTAADSVVLPVAKAGLTLLVRNNAANAMQVFAAGSDTINGTAGATGVSQAATTSALYWCPADGVWFRLLSA